MSVWNNETKLQELLKRLANLPPTMMKDVRKKAAETSPFLFALLYLRHHLTKKTSDFHKELYSIVGNIRVAIAAPRSFAKSTVFSFIYPLWCLVYAKKKDILLVSATGSLAEECLRKIKSELETNDLIAKDFGDMQSTKWTEAHIILKNGSQARAKGAGYQIRGFRPDCVVCDDLENDESVRSEEQREKLEDWFWKALVNTLDESTSQLLVVGTLLHPLSFLTKLIDSPKPGWWVKKYKAIKDDGSPLWPEKWPLDKLAARKAEIGEKRFRSEFMNDPIADSDVVFEKSDIDDNLVEVIPERKKLDVVSAVDPASSKKDHADYTAIVTIGQDKDTGHIYVIEAKRGKWGIYETVTEIISTYQRFRPRRVIAEEVAYQAVLKDVVVKECRERKMYIPIRPITPDNDKIRRAKGILHMFEQGSVHLQYDQTALMEELTLFPGGDHDDLVDALVYALSLINGGEASVKAPAKIDMKPQVSMFSLERATRTRRGKAWYNH